MLSQATEVVVSSSEPTEVEVLPMHLCWAWVMPPKLRGPNPMVLGGPNSKGLGRSCLAC